MSGNDGMLSCSEKERSNVWKDNMERVVNEESNRDSMWKEMQ